MCVFRNNNITITIQNCFVRDTHVSNKQFLLFSFYIPETHAKLIKERLTCTMVKSRLYYRQRLYIGWSKPYKTTQVFAHKLKSVVQNSFWSMCINQTVITTRLESSEHCGGYHKINHTRWKEVQVILYFILPEYKFINMHLQTRLKPMQE